MQWTLDLIKRVRQDTKWPNPAQWPQNEAIDRAFEWLRNNYGDQSGDDYMRLSFPNTDFHHSITVQLNRPFEDHGIGDPPIEAQMCGEDGQEKWCQASLNFDGAFDCEAYSLLALSIFYVELSAWLGDCINRYYSINATEDLIDLEYLPAGVEDIHV